MLTPRTFRDDIIHKELSYSLNGVLYKVHDELGRYAHERQYCDLIERYLKEKGISHEREKHISLAGIDRNRADFIIDSKIILEVKTTDFLTREHYYQVRRYLEGAKMKLGILVNFRQRYLTPKRILNPMV